MRRREFITLMGGAAAAGWPLAARAQQAERVRRIGVFVYLATDDPESSLRLGAFRQGLQALGWTENRNIRIEIHRYLGDPDSIRAAAAELVGLVPEVILSYGPAGVAALRRETRSIPIVFAQVTNPLGAGLVASMARPGGNITGFSSAELSIAGKWLEATDTIDPLQPGKTFPVLAFAGPDQRLVIEQILGADTFRRIRPGLIGPPARERAAHPITHP
jgi:putative ABC transport system substrate-binding protein